MTQNLFAVQGTQTTLNGQPFLVKGLRCSNALLSDESADQLIDHLDVFAGYGINTVSVYWMGNRFGDVKGYREDGSLDPVYAGRFERIIEAADARAMVVLVGCLYWGDSKAKWESWTQIEANTAVYHSVDWLRERDYRNVFVDVDNEGMALRSAGFDNQKLVRAGKADRQMWLGTFEALEYLCKLGRFMPRSIAETLHRLGLSHAKVGIPEPIDT